jgi:hypothetical protein
VAVAKRRAAAVADDDDLNVVSSAKPDNRGYVSGGGLVPVPDPTKLTTDQLRQEIKSLRELLETRMDGTDNRYNDLRALVQSYQDMIDAATAHLRDLVEEKIDGRIGERISGRIEILDQKISRLAEVTNERFDGVEKQFTERDKRGEQLSLSDKTAVNAALAAQEKQAIAQQESNNAAGQKMENNFTKLIQQQTELLQEVRRNTDTQITEMRRSNDGQIGDLKSRLDKGEGRSGYSDPATSKALEMLTTAVGHLTATKNEMRGAERGKADYTTAIFGAAGFVAAVIVIIGGIIGFSVVGSKGTNGTAPIIIERSTTGDKVVQ